MTNQEIVAKLWNLCNVLRDDGITSVSYTHLPTAKCEKTYAKLPDEEELKAFLFDVCKAEPNWNMKNFIEDQIELVRQQVGDRKVRCV